MPASSATRRRVSSPQRPRAPGDRKTCDSAAVSWWREASCRSNPPSMCWRCNSTSRICFSSRSTASATGGAAALPERADRGSHRERQNNPSKKCCGSHRATNPVWHTGSKSAREERILIRSRIHRDVEKSDHHLFPTLMTVADFGGGIGIAWIVGGVVERCDPFEPGSLLQRHGPGQAV